MASPTTPPILAVATIVVPAPVATVADAFAVLTPSVPMIAAIKLEILSAAVAPTLNWLAAGETLLATAV